MNITFDLNTIWFLLVGILFTGYAILDGFDLGVGALHLFTKTDAERRIMINAIGPVWDGNEVWLVTGGGALFAAFPEAYATAFSGFYLAFMLLLGGLIFRAVAIEFRSKNEAQWWRTFWDVSFCVSSIISSLLAGVALGNVALGIPLDAHHEFVGSFVGLLNPFALLVGVLTLSLFVMHGAIYAVMKTEGELQTKIIQWVRGTMIFFILCYVATTMAALLFVPHLAANIREYPVLFVIPLLNMLAVANIPREIHHGRFWRAFLSSCAALALMMVLIGSEMYPNLILSSPNIANSLTIYNAASSARTLRTMLIFAIIGMPMVIGYTTTVYWIFRGKVKLDKGSY